MSMKLSNLLPAITTLAVILPSLPVAAQNFGNSGGYAPASNYAGGNYSAPPPNYQGHVFYVPAGLTVPVSLSTAISTDVARPGDAVQASITQTVTLGNGVIPAGTRVEGTITNAKSGGFLGRAGMLTVKFNRLLLPNGQEIPMATHIVGGIGKYAQIANGSDTVAGETWKNKVGQTVGRGLVGAGVGAALGTAVGAIAGAGRGRQPWNQGGHSYAALGAGRGAWSGAAIGGGLGAADGLFLRKGKNVVIASGTPLQLQLDAPLQMASFQTGAF